MSENKWLPEQDSNRELAQAPVLGYFSASTVAS